MQITFAGTIIAREAIDGGTDGVEGFLPKGEQASENQKFLRADWAVPVARGSRLHTLTGKITPAPFATVGAARLDMMTRFGLLPSEGTLTFEEDGVKVTFDPAVLKNYEVTSGEGVSYTMQLTFLAGSAKQTQVISDSTGDPITDSTGDSQLD